MQRLHALLFQKTFSLHFDEIQSGKLKLLSLSFSLPISDHNKSLDKWIESSVHWHTSLEATNFTLDSNSIKFVVDGSFFAELSTLMSASWKCFSDDISLESRDFVPVKELQCQNVYKSELCSYLSIFKFVEVLQSHSERKKNFVLEIGTDCASVVKDLNYFSLMKSISTFLHQVFREIQLTVKYLHLPAQTFKIRSYRDDEVSCNELSFDDKSNV